MSQIGHRSKRSARAAAAPCRWRPGVAVGGWLALVAWLPAGAQPAPTSQPGGLLVRAVIDRDTVPREGIVRVYVT